MWEWGGGEDTLCTWGVVKVWGWGYVVYVRSGEGVGGVGVRRGWWAGVRCFCSRLCKCMLNWAW